MALPFKQPVAQIHPGFGSPSYKGSATQTLVATGAATITISNTATTPSAGGTGFNLGGGPAPTAGRWHIRYTNATSTATFAVLVTVTDGTNTWTVGNVPALAATGYVDLIGDFNTDVSITSIAFAVTIGGTATSVPIDAEVALT